MIKETAEAFCPAGGDLAAPDMEASAITGAEEQQVAGGLGSDELSTGEDLGDIDLERKYDSPKKYKCPKCGTVTYVNGALSGVKCPRCGNKIK